MTVKNKNKNKLKTKQKKTHEVAKIKEDSIMKFQSLFGMCQIKEKNTNSYDCDNQIGSLP